MGEHLDKQNGIGDEGDNSFCPAEAKWGDFLVDDRGRQVGNTADK